MVDMMQDISIFGSGNLGRRALHEIGKASVNCFIDNDDTKQGDYIDDLPIISLDEWMNKYNKSKIVIAISQFDEVILQLKEKNIGFYEVWVPRYSVFCDTKEIVLNPYEKRELQLEEKNLNLEDNKKEISAINRFTDILWKQKPLFNHVEIETYNRCNGGCAFCPVSKKNDTREERFMSFGLFEKIIDELSELNYHGCLALFSNNEPFLDKRIIDFSKIVREKLPYARTHLFTNGTLLDIKKFTEIINYLDELVIDNYSEKLELIPNCKYIKEYCEVHSELKNKVTIVMRNPKEILEARGGTAPNRTNMQMIENVKCTHPFRQLIIRPDGKVSICCNDALGLTEMGDVSTESLLEVWNGKKMEKARKKLVCEGRKSIEICKYCDSLRLV